MKSEKIKIDDIVPAEYNPRKISKKEYKKLSKSISEFGLVDPIIINLKNMHIIGGHQRYDVLKEEYDEGRLFGDLELIRLGDIGWVFTETKLNIKSDEHEKALNIALNKISGQWDFDALDNLLGELNSLDFDITLTGFDSFDESLEFDKLLDKVEYDDEKASKKKQENNKDNETDDSVSDEYITDETVTDTTKDKEDNSKPSYYKITLLFDSEEEMVTEFDKLVEEGYNCRMSDS